MKTKSQLLLIAAVVLLPALLAAIWTGIPVRRLAPPFTGGASFPPSPLRFSKQTIGEPPRGMPLITNVQVLSGGRLLVSDAQRAAVLLYERTGDAWTERVLAADVGVPARCTLADLDGDGDEDLAASVLGNIYPDDGVIGRVEVFENDRGEYRRHIVLDDVRRTADVQPGDLDQDGDLDLAVAVFGYNRGQVYWLENVGGLRFREHELLDAAGVIHVPVADFDGDGDLDIAAVVTQDAEEVVVLENLGAGEFAPHQVWMTINFDLGSAGLVANDLDRDGDMDLLLPTGDNLEDFDSAPQPYHGCLWLENRGGWSFEPHRIATFGGAYAADAGDLDGDGDTDVVLVSMTNDWTHPEHASIVWLENDGRQQFRTWEVDRTPTDLVTVAIGDVDADGRPDVVAGGLHLRRPFDRLGRLTAWTNLGTAPP